MSEQLMHDMLAGRIDPFVVATHQIRNGQMSPAVVRSVDASIRSFVETGLLVSSELGVTVFSDGSNLRKIAERLARYNYHAAALVSTDEDVIADAAFTLFQLLDTTPAKLEQRRRLIGEFLPAFQTRGTPSSDLYYVCLSTVDVFWASTRFDRTYCHDVVKFGLEALRHAEDVDVQSSELCNLHFRLGVALNEVGSADVERLEESIRFLRKCIADEEHCRGDFLGSALNSLGYSLFLLGRLKQDRQTIRSAIETFKKALPYRVGDYEIGLTKTNLVNAERLLAAGTAEETAATAESLDQRIRPAKEIFSEVMSGRVRDSARDELLQTAMNHLLDLTNTPGVMEEPHLRARLDLAFGVGLLCSGDAPVAVCFLRAAARTWDSLPGEGTLLRSAATYYNLGLAFSTLRGLSDDNFYVGRAIDNFQHALQLFTTAGLHERAQICAKFVENLRSR